MELREVGLLEEVVVAPMLESWNTTTFSSGVDDELFPNVWNNLESSLPTNFYQQNPEFTLTNSSLLGLIMTPFDSNFTYPFTPHHESSYPFLDNKINDTTTPLIQFQEEEYTNRVMVEHGQFSTNFHGHGQQEDSTSSFNINHEEGGEKQSSSTTSKVKKVEGQPSKNLMAERRRRKRLNDRLSMLRSIVPKISKMDRTSILGDTIDYMKELLDKINRLREDEMGEETKNINLLGNLKQLKPNEAFIKNSPKFEVERRDVEARIEMCCAAKPGLLLSTVSTMEALGLDLQQCVISCFGDFSLQASCSEATEHRTILSCEDVKQVLFKTAGYGGRCV